MAILQGSTSAGLQIDKEGYRTYKIKWNVNAIPGDGPFLVAQTPGLPTIGSLWIYNGEVDPWVWCRPEMTITQRVKNESTIFYEVEQTFSNVLGKRCQDFPIEDPLLEPYNISGGYTKFTIEAVYDLFGNMITNSSWEQLRGQNVEFDNNRPNIKIQHNVYPLGIETFGPLVDCVNDDYLWGFPPRSIKLSNVSWERKVQGICNFYYSVTYEFEINSAPGGWDRAILDEGNKCVFGHWGGNMVEGFKWVVDKINGVPADPTNPSHFIKSIGRDGNPCHVVLDGKGSPVSTGGTGQPQIDKVTINLTPPSGITSGVQSINFTLGIKGKTFNVSTSFTDATDLANAINLSTARSFVTASVSGSDVLITGITNGVTFSTKVWTLYNTQEGYSLFDSTVNGTTTTTQQPIGSTADLVAGTVSIVYYPSADFTILGIPLVIGT